MEQFRDFLAMGGYAAFVWPAFGVSALVLGWLWIGSLRRLRGLERALAAQGIAQPGGGKGRAESGGKTGEGEAAS